MNFWKKLTKTEDDIPEDAGYNGYGYGEDEQDDGIVGVPNYEGGEQKEGGAQKPNVGGSEKVSIKLMKPTSHTDAPTVADYLIDGSIVMLDISDLQASSKESVLRLLDFLAGVVHVLDGQMIRSNRTTIVLANKGVDIAGFAPEAESAD